MVMDLIETAIRNLKRNRISAGLIASAEDFLAYIDTHLFPGCVAGTGDSVSLEQLGLHGHLRNRDVLFLDKYARGISPEEKRQIYLRNFGCDVFFSGINALSGTGEIFNLDGNGSRVAPVIYGPKKVFLVCGRNKITATAEEAIRRIKTTAAPKDAKRLGKNTPCVHTGTCIDCKSPDKICNYLTVIRGQFDEHRIEVIIIDRDLGY